MKRFFENYGFLAISAIVIALLIGMLTPVGFYIKNGVMALTGKFGDTTNNLVNGIDVNPYGQKDQEIENGYITFSSPESFTVSFFNTNWNGTIEYSTDAENWNAYSSAGTEISSVNNKLYFRGTGNTVILSNFDLDGSDISCSGNIENLLDYQTVANGGHPTMSQRAFMTLFADNSALTSVADLKLPSTNLAKECYKSMFSYTDLVYGPKVLPATVLAEGCYYGMFSNCMSLISTPSLPATTLAKSCYEYMFGGCESLATAPSLPATALAENCYRDMFNGCYSLVNAPSLSATTLAKYCYQSMFQDCYALTAAPALPATTLAEGCYYRMFYGCSSMTTASALPATVLAKDCYHGMFENCFDLKVIPALSATTLVEGCYVSMFEGTNVVGYDEVYDEGEILYSTPYRIPSSGTGSYDGSGTIDPSSYTNTYLKHMFDCSDYIPDINKTYYLPSDITVIY